MLLSLAISVIFLNSCGSSGLQQETANESILRYIFLCPGHSTPACQMTCDDRCNHYPSLTEAELCRESCSSECIQNCDGILLLYFTESR